MEQLKIGRMVLSICQTNCYYLHREQDRSVVVIDPADKGKQIYETLKSGGFQVEAILLTHGHFDHIWGANELKKLTGADIYAFEGERELLADTGLNVSGQAGRPATVTADVWLKDAAQVSVAGITFQVIATPGHTSGSCCYYIEDSKILLSGDTLFEGSVGRSDFPTGSMGDLVRSIKEKLLVLPPDVTVYPGHGDETTIADEKKYNPYCQ